VRAVSAHIIQAIDARISSFVATNNDAPTSNHHDANTGAVTKVVRFAQIQNKAFFDAILDYHVGAESTNLILKPLEGLRKHPDKDFVKRTLSASLASLIDEDVSMSEGFYALILSAFKSRY
jgi:hypothetical protein